MSGEAQQSSRIHPRLLSPQQVEYQENLSLSKLIPKFGAMATLSKLQPQAPSPSLQIDHPRSLTSCTWDQERLGGWEGNRERKDLRKQKPEKPEEKEVLEATYLGKSEPPESIMASCLFDCLRLFG